MPLNVFTPFTLIEAEKLNENFTFVQSSLTGLTDIAVTGAVTIASSALSAGPATIRWHVCTGSTANYTVTLPPVSGNAGKYFAIRGSNALTQIVTLDGNGSELIDGSLLRYIAAFESAILYCDGTQWFKVAGRSTAMRASMRYRTSPNLVLTSGIQIKIPFNVNLINVGGIADLTLKRVNIRRPGNYLINVFAVFLLTASNTSPNGGINSLEIFRNGSRYKDNTQYYYPNSPSNFNAFHSSGVMVPLNAGDYIEFYLYSSLAGNITVYTGGESAEPFLEVIEVNPW